MAKRRKSVSVVRDEGTATMAYARADTWARGAVGTAYGAIDDVGLVNGIAEMGGWGTVPVQQSDEAAGGLRA